MHSPPPPRLKLFVTGRVWKKGARLGRSCPLVFALDLRHLGGNGDLDLDTGLDVDNDLLDDLGRGVEAVNHVSTTLSPLLFFLLFGLFMYNVLNQTLVDAHLVEIPSLGTLTARGLTGGDLEVLGGQTDGALDAEVLALGALNELGADLLEGLDLAGGQGDTDLVGLLQRLLVGNGSDGSDVEEKSPGLERKRTGASKSPFSPFW